MWLIRQIWLLLVTAWVLTFVTSVAVHVTLTRDLLQTQLRLKNTEEATSLTTLLTAAKGSQDVMARVAEQQFATGRFQRLHVTGTEGKLLFQRAMTPAPRQAPAGVIALWPIESVPRTMVLADGGVQAIGRAEVESSSAALHDQLWRGSWQLVQALAVVGLGLVLLVSVAVLRLRRPLGAVVAQAVALQRGEYQTAPEPEVPELRRMARAMNAMVERLRVAFEGQTEQVEAMRLQISCDPLTGVLNRAHFLGRLSVALHSEDGARSGGLVLLRLMRLAAINSKLGHATTDSLISTLAHTLQAYSDRVAGAFVGRLNGSDFALVLPEGGMSAETAHAVVGVLKAALPTFAGQVGVAAGAVEMVHGAAIAELLSRADLALAGAESAGPFSVKLGTVHSASWADQGEHGWHERVRDALLQRRVQLGSFPVVDMRNRVLHMECPLRIQILAGGPYELAAHWLPVAVRSHLTPLADESALALVLTAIEEDGMTRCVNLSPASLADSSFVARSIALLQASPQAASKLWLEVAEVAAADQFDQLREFARQVRATGARFGLEHAGDHITRIERLFEAELDYVKLDASITTDVAADAGRARFVQGLVTMLHSMRLLVIAEGVSTAVDARALRYCGIDGLTGPWVTGPDPLPEDPSESG